MSLKITYLAHSAFLIQGSQTVIIDPFLTNNPLAKIKPKDLPKIDFVLVTHDHFDHLGDAFLICKNNGATLVAIHEVATSLTAKEGESGASLRAEGMNIGGKLIFDNLEIHMVEAKHSAGAGHPAGFIIKIDGKTIYHAGDTGLFKDMSLFPRFKIDLALLPIGDRYTMGPKEASEAVKLLKPKIVIPMHYNTWSIIVQDPNEFARLVRKAEVKILKPGEVIEL